MNVTPSHSCDLSPSNLSKLRSLSRMSSYDPLYYDSLLSPERNNDDTITEDDVFTAEEAKYRRQEEGYDIDTNTHYNAWLRLQHTFTSPKQLV